METMSQRMAKAMETLGDRDALTTFVDDFYTTDAYFEDPVQKADGRQAIRDMYFSMDKMFNDVGIEITDEVKQGDVVVARWVMTFKVKRWLPFELSLPGVSWLTMNSDGKCISHVDYWDALGMLGQMFPLKKMLNKYLPNRVAGLLSRA